MVDKRMWFGTRANMQWILPPRIDYEASKIGWNVNAPFVTGGRFIRRSATGAKHYNFTWDYKSRDDVRAITDIADGVYGVNPVVYFLDPFAMDKNLLPQFWATPALGNADAPLLVGTEEEDRPDLVATPQNDYRYPTYSAVYALTSGSERAEVFIPVPPGYKLWFGAHGSATGSAAVTVTPTTGPTSTAAATNLTLLPVTSSTRVNHSISGNSYTGALVGITGTTGSLTLSGLMAQVLPQNQTPPTGNFISGQGHSGCSFDGDPTLMQHSAALDKVGVSIDLVETEGWK